MGSIETSNHRKVQIVNEYFSTIGEKLACNLPVNSQEDQSTFITRVTPCMMNISVSYAGVAESLNKMKTNKACGPDKVAPRLLKYAGKELIPSLLALYNLSAYCNSVPSSWKTANVLALFKKDDETDKQNYRPISLLCVPDKLMESVVASTITTHISDHNLSHPHQWAYKKSYSTELLLVKMIEDWRMALDKNLVVGIAFVDFCKAFDSIPHHILLHKLQASGIVGDL